MKVIRIVQWSNGQTLENLVCDNVSPYYGKLSAQFLNNKLSDEIEFFVLRSKDFTTNSKGEK